MKTAQVYFIFTLFVFVNVVFPQSGIIEWQTGSPYSKTSHYYNYHYCQAGGGNQTYYNNDDAYSTGYAMFSSWDSYSECYDVQVDKYKTIYKVVFQRPTPTATLEKVEISVSSSTGGNIEGLSPNDYSLYAEDLFNTIGTGSVLFSYGSTGEYQDITSFASQYLSTGYFCVGALANNSDLAYVSFNYRITWKYPAHFEVKNNFNGGIVSVNSQNTASGAQFDEWLGTAVSLLALNQNYADYYRIWNASPETPLAPSKWTRNGIDVNYSSSHNFNITTNDHNSVYEAHLRKECNISLSNQFSGTSMGGEMQINGTWVTSIPTTKTVVEQNLLSVSAKDYYDANNIRYLFDKWSDNNTNRFRSIYPSAHGTYTALYKGYAIYTDQMRGLSFSGVREGDVYYIKLNWSDHPNSYVTQYHVYRYAKGPDGTTSPVHLTTLNRGTTTFTDHSYAYSPSNGDYQVYYDVKAYFSLDGTTSPDNYEMVRGEEIDNQAQKKGSQSEELIKEYAISNFPNPFNPTTRIAYQLPKAGHVQIKVYDAIGKEVATLVNEHLESGRYEAQFGENNLPSGMYIYTIKVNDYFASKKMLLIK